MLEGKLVGGDEAQERARTTGKFDYDAPLPGLEVVDRYTLKIRLKAPDYRFAYVLAVPNLAALAREVVEADELWLKNLEAVGLKVEFRKEKLPELRKMARLGKIPMRGDGWNGDDPDAENFMQLLYGPNAGQENQSRFNLREFNQLYEQARTLPASPERTALFSRMTELVVAYAPWRLTVHILEDHLHHRWIRNSVPYPIRSQVWMYTDVDSSLRGK